MCVVFCVLCCLQNNPVFSSVTYLIFQKMKIMSYVFRQSFFVTFITTGKKSSSRLSGGLCCCVSFWFWREIGSFFVVAGKFYYERKKKVLVAHLAGCAVVSVFGSGDYDRKKKF